MTSLLTNISYQAAAVVYAIFCGFFINRGARTRDRLCIVAASGKPVTAVI